MHDAIHTDRAVLDSGPGGLDRLRVCGPAGAADLYLFGAHVTSFTPTGGRDLLFMSDEAVLDGSKAIRGGIPLCFPWFGGRGEPSHGFARTTVWTLDSIRDDGDDVLVRLTLGSSDATRPLWPHEFAATYDVRVGSALTTTFACRNTGDADLQYEIALHTYLSLDDAESAEFTGFAGKRYLDQLTGKTDRHTGEARLKGEVDRVYEQLEPITVTSGGRSVRLTKSNSNSTILWNPHAEKAARTSDLGDDEWRRMVCVETANVGKHAIRLRPGQHHHTACRLEVADA